jgi:hypothetical protein
LPFPNLNEAFSPLRDNRTINWKQHIERQAKEKGEPKKTEKRLIDSFPSPYMGNIAKEDGQKDA